MVVPSNLPPTFHASHTICNSFGVSGFQPGPKVDGLSHLNWCRDDHGQGDRQGGAAEELADQSLEGEVERLPVWNPGMVEDSLQPFYGHSRLRIRSKLC